MNEVTGKPEWWTVIAKIKAGSVGEAIEDSKVWSNVIIVPKILQWNKGCGGAWFMKGGEWWSTSSSMECKSRDADSSIEVFIL